MPIKSFFSPQEQKQIMALRDAGCSIKKISTTVRRSRPNVTMFLNNPEEYRKLKALAAEKKGRKSSSKKIKKVPQINKLLATKSAKANFKSKVKKTSLAGATSSANSAKITPRDLAEFNKVILEHRCVIKFYTKLGERPSSIHSNMRKVYSPLHPPLPAVQYWAAQFRKGRQNILNDKQTVRQLTQFKNKKATLNKKTTTSSIKKKVKNAQKPKAIKKAPKVVKTEVKEEEPKVKPEIDPAEESGKKTAPKKLLDIKPFTIKLPGMDRLSKTLL